MPALTDLATARAALPRLAPLADAEVERLIADASDAIEGWCNRTFGPGTYTETYDSDGSGRLFLRRRPVVSIASISTGPPSFSAIVPPASYLFDPLTGEVRGATGGGWFPAAPYFWPSFACGFQAVRVAYAAGDDEVPPSVVGVCLSLVGRKAAHLAQDPSIRSQSMGNLSVTLAGPGLLPGLTDDDRRDLAPFRLWSL